MAGRHCPQQRRRLEPCRSWPAAIRAAAASPTLSMRGGWPIGWEFRSLPLILPTTSTGSSTILPRSMAVAALLIPACGATRGSSSAGSSIMPTPSGPRTWPRATTPSSRTRRTADRGSREVSMPPAISLMCSSTCRPHGWAECCCPWVGCRRTPSAAGQRHSGSSLPTSPTARRSALSHQASMRGSSATGLAAPARERLSPGTDACSVTMMASNTSRSASGTD